MAESSDRLGEVLERCVQHLAQNPGAEILNLPIPLRVKFTREDGGISSVNDPSPLYTGDLDILARAFVNMNQDAEEIPPLTNGKISGIPNEGAGSQLDILRLTEKYEGELREWKGYCNALTKAGQVQAETIANLVLLLKEK